ncbi:MAG: DUF86 domain-containing protein [Limisphaerales bacterium]
MERKLEIIGEAFARLESEDPATAEQFPDLRRIVGMRNRLVHAYAQLDLDVLWDTVTTYVPRLLRQVEAALTGSTRRHPAAWLRACFSRRMGKYSSATM